MAGDRSGQLFVLPLAEDAEDRRGSGRGGDDERSFAAVRDDLPAIGLAASERLGTGPAGVSLRVTLCEWLAVFVHLYFVRRPRNVRPLEERLQVIDHCAGGRDDDGLAACGIGTAIGVARPESANVRRDVNVPGLERRGCRTLPFIDRRPL